MSRASELILNTSWGGIVVGARHGRICSCELPTVGDHQSTPFRLGATRMGRVPADDREVLRQADAFVRGLFEGRRLRRPPLSWPATSPFVGKAWRAMATIPMGRTVSYQQLAGRAGRSRAARAAGTACGRNPLPLFVPCHRVLGSGGALGGFSSGLAWKRLLLAREGVL